jgi:hypothetical protein
VITVAALYVDPHGPYPTMPDVDCWDESRDARLYGGPHPVVAHPPCGPWGRLSHFCTRQPRDCAFIAVTQVRLNGGVLEHPAASKLWDWDGNSPRLPMPFEGADSFGGFSVELDQCDWGHVTRKRTWIYVVGVDREWVMRRILERRGSGVPTHSICNGRGQRLSNGEVRRRATALQARVTPSPFAEFLVEIARGVK